MFLSTFKTTSRVDLKQYLSDRLTSEYSLVTYKRVEPEVYEMNRLRLRLENLNAISKDKLIEEKEHIVNYLNYLSKLISKLQVSKQSGTLVTQKFEWKNLLAGNLVLGDLRFELCNVLFNFSVLYFQMGVEIKSLVFKKDITSTSESAIKEAMRYFQYASSGLFMVKTKVKQYFVQEPIMDFHEVMLNMYICLCTAEVQSMIFHLAESKNLDLELQASLAKGASELFLSLREYYKLEPLNCFDNSIVMKGINYYSNIYSVLANLKMKEVKVAEFDKTGMGMGKAISYLNACMVFVQENESIVSSKNTENLRYRSYNDFLKHKVKYELETLTAKNTKIYFQNVIDVKYLEHIKALNKVKAIDLVDDLDNKLENLFEALIPKEIQHLSKIYQSKLLELVLNELSSKYFSKQHLAVFFENLQKDKSRESSNILQVLMFKDISIENYSNLFSKIKQVQQSGGSNNIKSLIARLDIAREKANQRIKYLNNILEKEEINDKIIREKYQDQYCMAVKESKLYTKGFKERIADIKSRLDKANEIDSLSKKEIYDSMKQINLLSKSISEINSVINSMGDAAKYSSAVKEKYKEDKLFQALLEEHNSLHNHLQQLESTKEKIISLAKSDDPSIDELNKFNEETVLHAVHTTLGKKEYTEKFITTQNLNEQVRQDMVRLKATFEAFDKQMIVRQKEKKIEIKDIEDFIEMLEESCLLYNKFLKTLNHANSFYTQITGKMHDLELEIKQFLLKREVERNSTISIITKSDISTCGTSSVVNQLLKEIEELKNEKINLMDGGQNPITQLGANQLGYTYQGKNK